MLRWRANDDVEGTYHLMCHGRIFDCEDTLEECKMMGAMYVQVVGDSLNQRFPNLHVFNASKLVNQSIIQVMKKFVCMLEQQLERLIIKLGLTPVKSDACRAYVLEFVETLVHECENKSLYEA